MVEGGSHPDPAGETGVVTFSGLVWMFGTTALLHLGEGPPPGGGEKKQDLTQAKQVIDLLGVLQDKTKGNLTAEESRLLDNLLFDLRLRYLEAVKAG
jgi:hypothetical protein